MKLKSILSISPLILPPATATGMLRATLRHDPESGSDRSTNDESYFKRRLAKPECNDGTCRKKCSDCPPDSGVSSQECTTCLQSTTAATSTTSGPIKVACIIDSLSDVDFETMCGACIAYPPYLQTYLDSQYPGKFQVTEYAVWAATMCENIAGTPDYSDKPFKDQSEYGQVLADQPDYDIIMGGSNDSKGANWDTRNCKSVFRTHTEELYRDFISVGSTVFAAEPPAARLNSMGIRDSVIQLQLPMIQDAVDSVQSLGTAIKIPTHSFTAPHTVQWLNSDGVHFNSLGAEAVANFIGGYIIDECVRDGKCTTGTTSTVSSTAAATAASTATPSCQLTGACFGSCPECCYGFNNNKGTKTCRDAPV